MNIPCHRKVIYTKDVMELTGRSSAYCYRLIRAIKKNYGKQRKDFVGIQEFCAYTGLNEIEIREFLQKQAAS